jgi:acyl-CoA dehydrogenase
VSVVPQTRIDHRNAGLVRLEGVQVGRDAVLGEVGAGGALLARVLDRATAGLCAEMLGATSQVFEDTVQYLKTRVQFGVPIGSFQALKHRAARVFMEIELARSATMAAVRALDADDPEAAKLVSLAKARGSDAFVLAANEAVQMFGGVGMTDEYDVGFYLKRARVAEMTFGDAAWHRERWARLSGY